MKIKEIASKYNVNQFEFETFLRTNELSFSEGFTINVPDNLVEQYVSEFSGKKEEYQAALEVKQAEAAKYEKALSEILISSGFSFEGYKIIKYSGYISGDDATQIDRTLSFMSEKNGQNLTDALVKIRRNALRELKEAAYDLGCNAVIGVDFDYITLEPETASLTGKTVYQPYVICVTANGNAVIIEKE